MFLALNFKVVELDFQYPYEAIYERWNQGYFITSVAATPDQVAFVFSIPGEVPVRGSQEAVQTSHFPETVAMVIILGHFTSI